MQDYLLLIKILIFRLYWNNSQMNRIILMVLFSFSGCFFVMPSLTLDPLRLQQFTVVHRPHLDIFYKNWVRPAWLLVPTLVVYTGPGIVNIWYCTWKISTYPSQTSGEPAVLLPFYNRLGDYWIRWLCHFYFSCFWFYWALQYIT